MPAPISIALSVTRPLSKPEVGLVGALLEACHIAGVGQVDVPAGLGDRLVGQVGRTGAGLDRRPWLGGVLGDNGRDGLPVVLAGAVSQDLPLAVEDADLDGVAVVVDPDVDRGVAHGGRLRW